MRHRERNRTSRAVASNGTQYRLEEESFDSTGILGEVGGRALNFSIYNAEEEEVLLERLKRRLDVC